VITLAGHRDLTASERSIVVRRYLRGRTIISTIILIGQYLREILLAGLFGLGLLLIVDNLGEVRRLIRR